MDGVLKAKEVEEKRGKNGETKKHNQIFF